MSKRSNFHPTRSLWVLKAQVWEGFPVKNGLTNSTEAMTKTILLQGRLVFWPYLSLVASVWSTLSSPCGSGSTGCQTTGTIRTSGLHGSDHICLTAFSGSQLQSSGPSLASEGLWWSVSQRSLRSLPSPGHSLAIGLMLQLCTTRSTWSLSNRSQLSNQHKMLHRI